MKKHDLEKLKLSSTPARSAKPIIAAFVVLILCLMFVGCSSGVARALTAEDVLISSFSEERVSSIQVSFGTPADAIGLPCEILANIQVSPEGVTGEPDTQETAPAEEQTVQILELRNVPVSWECAAYDSCKAGAYVFLAVLEPGYVFDGELPTVTVDVLAEGYDASAQGTEATPEPSATPDASVTPEPSVTPEGTPPFDPALEYVIVSFVNEPIEICVERGTAEEDIPLPATLPAINGNGVQIDVPVVWTCSAADDALYGDETMYTLESRFGYGPWVFTASIANPDTSSLTEATDPAEAVDIESEEAEAAELAITYSYAGEPVTASVSILDCTDIENFCGISSDGLLMRFVVFEGGSVRLPDETGAYMSDGGYRTVPISWNGSFDVDKAGEYTLRMNVESGFSGGGRAFAEVVVLSTSLTSADETDDENVIILG